MASALADLENDGLVTAVVDRLRDAGKVVADVRSVALAGHEPKLSQAERKLKKEIAEAYGTGGFTPPDPADWYSRLGARAATVPDLLALLRDEDRLVEVGPGLYLDHDAESEMRRRVADRLSGGGGMTVAEFRDLLGTSRKFAVPLAEYLDRAGLTRREGDLRVLAAPEPVEPGGSVP